MIKAEIRYCIFMTAIIISFIMGLAFNNWHLVNHAPEFNCEEYEIVEWQKLDSWEEEKIDDKHIRITAFHHIPVKSLECVK